MEASYTAISWSFSDVHHSSRERFPPLPAQSSSHRCALKSSPSAVKDAPLWTRHKPCQAPSRLGRRRLPRPKSPSIMQKRAARQRLSPPVCKSEARPKAIQADLWRRSAPSGLSLSVRLCEALPVLYVITSGLPALTAKSRLVAPYTMGVPRQHFRLTYAQIGDARCSRRVH